MGSMRFGDKGIEEEWCKMEKVKEAMRNTEMGKERKKGWWDEECEERKKEVKKN